MSGIYVLTLSTLVKHGAIADECVRLAKPAKPEGSRLFTVHRKDQWKGAYRNPIGVKAMLCPCARKEISSVSSRTSSSFSVLIQIDILSRHRAAKTSEKHARPLSAYWMSLTGPAQRVQRP